MYFLEFFCILVDGNWGEWSNFTDCSVTCGFGYIMRQRFCDSPSPNHGGKDCAGGKTVEYIHGCNPTPCPSK